ncbi:putative membrane protein YpjA [Pullulanibacillus pueri]|uniref:DUF1405 domain-containing protein n=1 Tax=Pullulanibacillus pueri TaxID=1437324 RepID=A0A8J2ZV97_9BACL|nr:DUF1405 domain-containing protein [Pullulanibacillus pueri]MBM7681447.1 putative membrane protein YpjA [Pullulanibacillus pueri]GGH78914.1 hypothetical protein GCM10007096_13060 [Pullulanibacillus pueri]
MPVIWYHVLRQRSVLLLLLIVNTVGTIYGYYWYKYQLMDTPTRFLLFVPDSPTASLFFCLVLFAFLCKRHFPLIEALAMTSLFKYGVWAVGMNIASGFTGFHLTSANYMLIISHGCMALEGLLYAPFYKMKIWHLMVAGVVLLHNDIIDYVFNMMPRYDPLAAHQDLIGYITFWLSLFSIFLTYWLCIRYQKNTDYI